MTEQQRKEEQCRLQCEAVVNESWSKVEELFKEITVALKATNPTKEQILLLKIGVRALLSKIELDRLESRTLFGVDPNEV